jgi:hypothetical protein
MTRKQRTAISYTRFSSARQAIGHSEERQIENARAYAKRKGFILQEFVERGVSAFHGKNASEGILGRLIAKVKAGELPKDTILIVEDTDRISRDVWAKAYEVAYLPLTQAGIEIHFLSFNAVLKPDHNYYDTIAIGVKHDQGHQESEKKSFRVGKSWTKKRHNASGKAAMSARVPQWLIAEKGQAIRVQPERAKVVRRIYEWAARGLGQYQICDKLIAAGVEPWGPVFKGRAPRWTPHYVDEILRSERVLGHYQPMTKVRVEVDSETGEEKRIPLEKRVADGELVKDYYPQVVSYELWQKVQDVRRAFAQAKFGDALYAGKSKFSDKNLFRKLIWDADNKVPMFYRGYESHPCLVSTYRKDLRSHKVQYPVFEAAFLKFLSEADWKAIASENASPANAQLRAQLEAVAKAITDNERVLARYESILDDPESKDSERINSKYQAAVKESGRLAAERAKLEGEISATTVGGEQLASTTASDFSLRKTEDRLKLRLRIAQRVERIDFTFGTVPITLDGKPLSGHTVAIIHFINGALRGILFHGERVLILHLEPKKPGAAPREVAHEELAVTISPLRATRLPAARPDRRFRQTQAMAAKVSF